MFKEHAQTAMPEEPETKYYSLKRVEEAGLCKIDSLPYSIRVLVENILRNVDGEVITDADVKNIASWTPNTSNVDIEIPFKPSRVVLQDFTGVPVLVDLAAMRSALSRMSLNPDMINPLVPADLIIDHSVQVDFSGTLTSLSLNIGKEFERNTERYAFLKWAQQAFTNLRVAPPGRGIVHQVNLEYLAKVVDVRASNGVKESFPDTLVGTDSHTPMVNALGVLGWGVGGIEAEAVMLGQPYYMLVPEVVGVRLNGGLPEGATATDLVLTLTEKLRSHGVVGKFVEYFGPSLKKLSIPDRATIANMAPEYGATVGFFPTDQETLAYLRFTGRDESHIRLVEEYARLQGLFFDDRLEPSYSEVIDVSLSEVEPTIAGPTNPEERITLKETKEKFLLIMQQYFRERGVTTEIKNGTLWFHESSGTTGTSLLRTANDSAEAFALNGRKTQLKHGDIVISAITSCTNTSNPSVMVGAALLAKKAVEKGLQVNPYVKTSLAPGSLVVSEYLSASGLTPYLEELGYYLVGYGCTTCIGNSGPLPEPVAEAIRSRDLYTVAVLSGNRNFEGRIHPLVRSSFLMSPLLVVAYGLAGRMDIDLLTEPLGQRKNGEPVYLRDVWPSMEEIGQIISSSLKPEMFLKQYSEVFKGDERWQALEIPDTGKYEWGAESTYIQEPPFFKNLGLEPPSLREVEDARVLALLGDRVTTDHISPAGSISAASPAGKFLVDKGIDWADFNTYGSRRGNHEVLIRGTFANIRLRNQLVPRKEGWWTLYLPDKTEKTIYDASMQYMENRIPLIILAGKQYGTGSSRDWAAKGTSLLGVKAVIAESYERIHRGNLVGMGVLPLQFEEGQSWKSLGLTGFETYSITGIAEGLTPRKKLTVTAKASDGSQKTFTVTARLETPIEVEYYRHGGILQYVLRKISVQKAATDRTTPL